MQPIPKCDYVIKKGEKPLPGRGNIHCWTPELSLKSDKWEPLTYPLPELHEESQAAADVKAPTDAEEAVRWSLIVKAMENLEEDELTLQGLPRIDSIKNLTGIEITAQERDKAWTEVLEKRKAGK